MRITIGKVESLRGELLPPPSKFLTQLSVALAAVCNGRTELFSPLLVGDTLSLIHAVQKVGTKISRSGNKLVIWGTAGKIEPSVRAIDVKNSATSFAFLSSMCALAGEVVVVTGDKSLRSRPLPDLLDGLRKIGITVESTQSKNSPPFVIMKSNLKGGVVKTDVRDKYIPAIVLPCLFGKKEYKLLVNVGRRTKESIPVMHAAGVEVGVKSSGIRISPAVPQGFKYTVPRDLNMLAPFIVATLLSDSRVKMKAENESEILLFLRRFGMEWERRGSYLILEGPQTPKPAKVEVSDFPEFLPFLSVVACFARGTTLLSGVQNARNAKTDRVSATVFSLKKMGAKIEEKKDEVVIHGPARLKGTTVDARGDPCMAAALIVAGMLAEGHTCIENAVHPLRLTYPGFLRSLRELGAETEIS